MKNHFPLTLEAVQKGERSQWAIGDALVKEIEEAETAHSLADCSNMLKEHGYFEYSDSYLRKLKTTAESFSRSERLDDVAWGAHAAAGTPENLQRAAKAIRKLGQKVTQTSIEMVMRAWREEDEREREREAEQAKQDQKEAEAEMRAAREQKQKARDDAERKQAEHREKQAKQKKTDAVSRKLAAKPPKTKTFASEPPDTSTLEVHAVCMKIEADAKLMAKTLRDNLNDLDKILDNIDPDFANGIIDAHAKIIKLAEQINSRFAAKRDRFKVHQGGKAS